MGAENSEVLTERMYSTSCGVQSSTDQNTVASFINSLKLYSVESFGALRSANKKQS